MKNSFVGKFRNFLILIVLISVIQGVLIVHTFSTDKLSEEKKTDVINIISASIGSQIVFLFIFIIYIPVIRKKIFVDIHKIIKEISKGNYQTDFDFQTIADKNDKSIAEIILSLKKMLSMIQKFEKARKEKIIEHKNRILKILRLTENGFMIVTLDGEIRFISDNITDVFPSIYENVNIVNSNFPPVIENSIKKYITNILREKSSSTAQGFFIPSLKKHIVLKSSIVQDSSGMVTGAVIAIHNINEKKKIDKEAKQLAT